MRKCGACGHTNEADGVFCSKCGTSLDTQSSRTTGREEANSKRGNSSKKKIPLLLASVAILLIILFTGYQMLNKKYSEEAVIEQFKTALSKKDKNALKQLIVPADSRIKVSSESLDALFMLIDKEPSLVQDIEESLHNEGLGSNLFYLREDGKHYGLFNRYVVDTPGYFIHTESTSEGTTVYLNDNEIGVLDKAKEAQEFGPFLAGSYKVKGMKKSAAGSTEDEVALELAGTKTEQEITLNTGNSEEETEKEEVKEKTVVKEVIREVAPKSSQASYSYYLIPHSDYAYLTYDDLSGLSKSELRLARNEIYARHGYIFNSKDLQNYFSSQSWYSPNPGYGGSLSSVEKHNVDFIKSFE